MASGHIKIIIIVLMTFIPYAYTYETTKETVVYTALKAGNQMDTQTTIVSTNTIGYFEPMDVNGKTYVFLSRQEIQELADSEERPISYFEFSGYSHIVFETTVSLSFLRKFPRESSGSETYESHRVTVFYDLLKGKWVYRVTSSTIA